MPWAEVKTNVMPWKMPFNRMTQLIHIQTLTFTF